MMMHTIFVTMRITLGLLVAIIMIYFAADGRSSAFNTIFLLWSSLNPRLRMCVFCVVCCNASNLDIVDIEYLDNIVYI